MALVSCKASGLILTAGTGRHLLSAGIPNPTNSIRVCATRICRKRAIADQVRLTGRSKEQMLLGHRMCNHSGLMQKDPSEGGLSVSSLVSQLHTTYSFAISLLLLHYLQRT